ncbi:MAG: hypothetical protein JO337_03945 [Acidimicrobiales bacterium]|nr:hypothetical protein [Acidimicrobiales bacterium]
MSRLFRWFGAAGLVAAGAGGLSACNSSLRTSATTTPTVVTAPSAAAPAYRTVGLDAYELATDWGVNRGCGSMLSDSQLDSFFAGLPARTLVRIWAFQWSMAIDLHAGSIVWRPLDRVFAAAARHGDSLIVSLANQSGTCDGGQWKGMSWYAGGFAGAPVSGDELPYSNYVDQVVSRYADAPALAMWEPVNEAEASDCDPGHAGDGCYGHDSCPDDHAAATALRGFFDDVGARIHRLDPRHPVEAGFLGSGQCGTSNDDFSYVGASPGIDVLSYHDYYDPSLAVGGDTWNGIAVRERQAEGLGKPLIAGEMGIKAGPGASCTSPLARRSELAAKISAQHALGTSHVLLWDWDPAASGCDYNFGPDDPSMALLRQFR